MATMAMLSPARSGMSTTAACFHEAGHGVAAWALLHRWSHVSVNAEGGGECSLQPYCAELDTTREHAVRTAAYYAAGPIAEAVHIGEPAPVIEGTDLAGLDGLCGTFPDIRATALRLASRVVSRHWREVQLVAA